jgi:hypothetical protein
MPINKEWHLKNRMPKNPSREQRLRWHIGHAKHCACRLPSEKLAREMADFLKEQNA